MKKILFLIMLFLAFNAETKAQFSSDRMSFGQGNFFLNGSYISFQQAREIMRVNEEASQYMKRARANRTWSNILSYPGYFVIGWGIGGFLGGVPFSDSAPYLGIGAGLIAGSVLLDLGFSKNADLAVNLFNTSMPTGHKSTDVQLLAGFTSSGIGLKLAF